MEITLQKGDFPVTEADKTTGEKMVCKENQKKEKDLEIWKIHRGIPRLICHQKIVPQKEKSAYKIMVKNCIDTCV